jgi:hypothetical protein
MDSRTFVRSLPIAFASLTSAALLIAGCTSAFTNSGGSGAATDTGPAFVVGTDAPLASVVAFPVTVENVCAVGIPANTTATQCVPLLSGTPTVDFARFNGLQTLLDMNDVPVGTYSQIEITLGSAQISYLNMPVSGAPTIVTETATYPASASTFTYTATLASPLVVTKAGTPVGLHMDFDLRKSIAVDGSGNFTGQVTPTFDVNTVGTGDAGGYIDTLDAAVVSVNTTAQSFVVQGPHGRQFTINVNGQTEWENNESLSALTTSSIVQVSGELDKADATLNADDVAILSQDGFYAGGQVTYVQPSSGPATSFDLYVRGLLPTTTGITLGQIAQVDLTGNEKFFIYWMHNPLTQFLFNSSTLLPGQHVSVGGPASGAANADAVTAKRVVLRHWGFNGTVVPGSMSTAAGTFQMQITGFAGLLVPQTVTVYTASPTVFRGGLTGLSGVPASTNVRVVGLLIKDPTSGKTVLLAHYVDALL